MTYGVKHLKFNGEYWTATLMRWDGCMCNAKEKKVEIHQVKRPSLKEIKDCVIW